MTQTSRPLRALGVVLGGWTAARVVALWPVNGTGVDASLLDAAPVEPTRAVVAVPLDDKVPLFAKRPLSPRGMKVLRQAHGKALAERLATAVGSPVIGRKFEATPTSGIADARAEPGNVIAPGLPRVQPKNRFSGSAWALMRGNGAVSLANGGQLGGSQIGMRLFYVPGPDALALTARISTPLSQPGGREAALGVALRGRNVGLIAEQRIALDRGGRSAPSVFAYGGVSDVRLGGGVNLDGYVQAGVVGVKNASAFVDGAIRIERAVVTTERATLSVGAGAWGGAQKGVARIDVGPQIVARLAVADTNLRVSAEWRQRVAGDAAPASGPSVTVGFDF
jgi:hypothetical protein